MVTGFDAMLRTYSRLYSTGTGSPEMIPARDGRATAGRGTRCPGSGRLSRQGSRLRLHVRSAPGGNGIVRSRAEIPGTACTLLQLRQGRDRPICHPPLRSPLGPHRSCLPAMGITIELMRVGTEAAQSATAGRAWPRPQMREGERFRATLSLDKSWNALQWLLAAAGCPVDPVMGTPFLEDQPFDYAPPGVLTLEEATQASAFLTGLDFDTLTDFADEDAMDEDDVYPYGYDKQRTQQLRGHYTDLQAFYEAAAHAQQWVITEMI
ncbi:DUF1877 family protein [Streptomyces sp. NPDC050738]|uniref:DUF1877 family protein n=1 Tax=Streptomyces sp. NPDC050738 TaxID=3154744 RepID=UPI003416BC8B